MTPKESKDMHGKFGEARGFRDRAMTWTRTLSVDADSDADADADADANTNDRVSSVLLNFLETRWKMDERHDESVRTQ